MFSAVNSTAGSTVNNFMFVNVCSQHLEHGEMRPEHCSSQPSVQRQGDHRQVTNTNQQIYKVS